MSSVSTPPKGLKKGKGKTDLKGSPGGSSVGSKGQPSGPGSPSMRSGPSASPSNRRPSLSGGSLSGSPSSPGSSSPPTSAHPHYHKGIQGKGGKVTEGGKVVGAKMVEGGKMMEGGKMVGKKATAESTVAHHPHYHKGLLEKGQEKGQGKGEQSPGKTSQRAPHFHKGLQEKSSKGSSPSSSPHQHFHKGLGKVLSKKMGADAADRDPAQREDAMNFLASPQPAERKTPDEQPQEVPTEIATRNIKYYSIEFVGGSDRTPTSASCRFQSGILSDAGVVAQTFGIGDEEEGNGDADAAGASSFGSDAFDYDFENAGRFLKFVPKALLTFGVVDWLSVIMASTNQVCDAPLANWLLGGVALGFPATLLVQTVAGWKPQYNRFRVRVLKLRNGMKFGEDGELIVKKKRKNDQGKSGGKGFKGTGSRGKIGSSTKEEEAERIKAIEAARDIKVECSLSLRDNHGWDRNRECGMRVKVYKKAEIPIIPAPIRGSIGGNRASALAATGPDGAVPDGTGPDGAGPNLSANPNTDNPTPSTNPIAENSNSSKDNSSNPNSPTQSSPSLADFQRVRKQLKEHLEKALPSLFGPRGNPLPGRVAAETMFSKAGGICPGKYWLHSSTSQPAQYDPVSWVLEVAQDEKLGPDYCGSCFSNVPGVGGGMEGGIVGGGGGNGGSAAGGSATGGGGGSLGDGGGGASPDAGADGTEGANADVVDSNTAGEAKESDAKEKIPAQEFPAKDMGQKFPIPRKFDQACYSKDSELEWYPVHEVRNYAFPFGRGVQTEVFNLGAKIVPHNLSAEELDEQMRSRSSQGFAGASRVGAKRKGKISRDFFEKKISAKFSKKDTYGNGGGRGGRKDTDREFTDEHADFDQSDDEYDDFANLGKNQFRRAFLLELCLDLAAFIWLAVGTTYVSGAEFCIDSAPMLWWYSMRVQNKRDLIPKSLNQIINLMDSKRPRFIILLLITSRWISIHTRVTWIHTRISWILHQVVTSWAVLGIGTLFLILSSIAAVVVQTKKSQAKKAA